MAGASPARDPHTSSPKLLLLVLVFGLLLVCFINTASSGDDVEAAKAATIAKGLAAEKAWEAETAAKITRQPPPPPFSDVYPQYPHNLSPNMSDTLKNCSHRLLGHMKNVPHYSDSIGWPDDLAILGTILVTDGRGGLWRQETGQYETHDKFRGIELEQSIAGHMRMLKRETIIFFSIHDVDFWTLVAHEKYAEARHRTNAILDACPMIWFAHYNPCTMNHETGRLPRRTIVVPDFSVGYFEDKWRPPNASSPPPKKQVVWRGAALGRGLDLTVSLNDTFNASDRYHVVATLGKLEEEGLSDVGYTDWVRPENVGAPPGLKNSSTMEAQAENYRLVLDVDGLANSWFGLRHKLGIGAAVLKAYSTWGCTQWYYPMLTHGEEVYLFDPHITTGEMRSILKSLLLVGKEGDGRASQARTTATTTYQMGVKANAFAKKYLTHRAAQAYILDTITSLWEKEAELEGRDWRIRNFTIPSSRMEPFRYKFQP